ncbi:ABC transporter substrate-binding protein [Tepidiforma sp.]|uniref:ABC transporter substrate-binding protein n=1 Tax=Tepidiforma sp. TaxID=2682230 RepID=UPI002ADE6543|nr:ABC transporter substrate-binding protein [Tepidiforma sp.]
MPRITRRRFLLGSSVIAATAAGGALLAARTRTPPTSTPPAHPTPLPSTAPTPTPLPRGGTLTIATTGSLQADTFDVLRTGIPAAIEILGRVHARLLQWADPAAAILGPDLATAFEQPDPQTLLLRLDPRGRWHDAPPLDGRPVAPEEVRASLERLAAAARRADTLAGRRSAPLADIARVELPQPGLLRLVLHQPSPLLTTALAGEYALLQHPDLVDRFDPEVPLDSTLLAGCGPWRLDAFDSASARFVAQIGGHRTPLLDSLTVTSPFDVVERYRAGHLDEFPAFDPRDADSARALPEIQQLRTFLREPVISTFATSAPPWSDTRLLDAISGALDRHWLAATLFAGRAQPSGPLPPVYAATLDAQALAPFPGFSTDPDADARAARQRWEAANGPALGTIVIDFPAIFDPRYAAAAHIVRRLATVLGPQFQPAIERYPTIAERIEQGYYGNGRAAFWFGWAAALPSPDPREALLQLHGHALDPAAHRQILDGQPSALAELQRNLLAGFPSGVIPWIQQTIEIFRRPDTFGPTPSPFWDGQRDISRYRAP